MTRERENTVGSVTHHSRDETRYFTQRQTGNDIIGSCSCGKWSVSVAASRPFARIAQVRWWWGHVMADHPDYTEPWSVEDL